jgi:glycosyltransferase involved in cell wall biosynthesis
VYEQAKSVREADKATGVVVVAPHGPGLATSESIDGLQIDRPRYFWPSRLQRLAYQHEGLFETVRSSRLAALQLPLLFMAMSLRLWRVTKNAHVIHAQWVPTAAIALGVGRLRRIPVVVSVRGADLNTARRSRVGRAMTRAIIRRVNYVVTVSDEFRDVLAAEVGCQTPLAALYNGVDTDQFRPRSKAHCRAALGLPEREPFALYVGGLVERKGVSILIRALAHETMSGHPIQVYLAGEGPQAEQLRVLASGLGLSDRVHFLGRVPKSQVHLWMGAADMLVLPSYSEGRPNVVLEAMASGTPVVATAVSGTTELISDGENGLLFEAGDVAALGACLKRVSAHPELAERLSNRGPQTIAERGLLWSTHGRRLLSIYQRVVGNR